MLRTAKYTHRSCDFCKISPLGRSSRRIYSIGDGLSAIGNAQTQRTKARGRNFRDNRKNIKHSCPAVEYRVYQTPHLWTCATFRVTSNQFNKIYRGLSALDTTPFILENVSNGIQALDSRYSIATYHSSHFIPSIHNVGKCKDTADTSRDICPIVTVIVDVMELANQLQFKAAVSDHFVPNLRYLSIMFANQTVSRRYLR